MANIANLVNFSRNTPVSTGTGTGTGTDAFAGLDRLLDYSSEDDSMCGTALDLVSSKNLSRMRSPG